MRRRFAGLLKGFTRVVEGAAEAFRVRRRDPARDRRATNGSIPHDVAARVRRRYERVERKLKYDAEPPKNVRYEYLPLRSDPRPGEYQIGALLPTNEDDTLDLSEPIRFYVVVSEQVPDDGRYRRYQDDRFAGPFEA